MKVCSVANSIEKSMFLLEHLVAVHIQENLPAQQQDVGACLP